MQNLLDVVSVRPDYGIKFIKEVSDFLVNADQKFKKKDIGIEYAEIGDNGELKIFVDIKGKKTHIFTVPKEAWSF